MGKPKNNMSKMIVMQQPKGGSKKSTTAATIATGLTAFGHKVVIVDTDPQKTSFVFMGPDNRGVNLKAQIEGLDAKIKKSENSKGAFSFKSSIQELPFKKQIVETGLNLYVTARDVRNSEPEILDMLIEVLTTYADYDYIIIDLKGEYSKYHEVITKHADLVVVPISGSSIEIKPSLDWSDNVKDLSNVRSVFVGDLEALKSNESDVQTLDWVNELNKKIKPLESTLSISKYVKKYYEQGLGIIEVQDNHKVDSKVLRKLQNEVMNLVTEIKTIMNKGE